jgi:hypothetical protein
MWTMPQQIERRKVNDPYRYFNYALLHTVGMDNVFNVLRYNVAFLVRRSDYEYLLKAAEGENYSDYMLRRASLLLCRYDWAGKTKAHWAHDHLLSTQEIEEITDPYALYELEADQTELRTPKPALKWEHILTVKGTLQYVLQVMYDNRAMPYEETDANKIERAFQPYVECGEIEVRLRNFLGVETEWKLPD